MNATQKKLIFFSLLLSLSSYGVVQAQISGPGMPIEDETPCQDPDDPDCDPTNPVPIDGGASILIAAGVAYGVKKFYNKRNQKTDDGLA